MPSILYDEQVSLKVPGSAEEIKVDNPLQLFPIEVIPSDFRDRTDDEVCYNFLLIPIPDFS